MAYFHGLYFDTRMSTDCGECGKRIIKGAVCAIIHRGSHYGQGKAFHMSCAIKIYDDNLTECKRVIKNAGQRRNPKISL